MSFITIFLIALSLSMDCFAVSVAGGIASKFNRSLGLKMSFSFGFFQSFMAIIGWFAGSSAVLIIKKYDHILAFLLLLIVGLKMVYESFREEANKMIQDKILNIFLLSISTSIDSMGVGVGIGVLRVGILIPSIMFGAVSFLVSIIGFSIGGTIGKLLKRWAELTGGIILILIGFKILVSSI